MNEEELLLHYGVKGMKWGVRKSASRRLNRATNKLNSSYNKGLKGSDKRALKKISSSTARKKYLDEKDAKWLEKAKDDKKVQKVSSKTARDMKRVGKELKVEYGGGIARSLHPRNRAKFQNELQSAYEEILSANTYSVYKMSPSRTKQVTIKSMGDGTLKAVVENRSTAKLDRQMAKVTKGALKYGQREAKKSLKHSDEDLEILDGMFFVITTDEQGWPDDVFEFTDDALTQNDDDTYISDPLPTELTLVQFGVKGMKWGVRRNRTRSGSTTNSHRSILKRKKNTDGESEESVKPKKLSKRQQAKEAERLRKESNRAAKATRKEFMQRSQLTDAELKKKVERLELEVKFDKLSKEMSASQIEKGKSEIQKLLSTKVPPMLKEDLKSKGFEGATVGQVIANKAISEAKAQVLKKMAGGDGPSTKTTSQSTTSNTSVPKWGKTKSTPTSSSTDLSTYRRPRKDVTPG